MPFVVDNSVVVGWYFESQATPYTDRVLDLLANETAHVPALWVLEFSNVLRKALKAGKADTARIQEIITLVNALPISVDHTSVECRKQPGPGAAIWVNQLRCRLPGLGNSAAAPHCRQ